MKTSRTLGQLVAVFFSVSTASAWPGFLPDIDALVVRANSQTSSAAQPSQTATTGSTSTDSGSALTTGDLNTATFNPSATGVATVGTGSNSTNTTHQTFDAESPAGTITMMTPAATTMALFKISDFATFVWNYTNLLATPTAVDVLAYNSADSQTHTLTQNMSFAVPNTFIWDTEKYQNEHGASKGLRVAQYTLTIYDADSNPTATSEPGYLAVYNSLQFGLYTGQSYTPLSEWTCAACSGAQNLGPAGAVGFAVTAAFAVGVGLMIL